MCRSENRSRRGERRGKPGFLTGRSARRRMWVRWRATSPWQARCKLTRRSRPGTVAHAMLSIRAGKRDHSGKGRPTSKLTTTTSAWTLRRASNCISCGLRRSGGAFPVGRARSCRIDIGGSEVRLRAVEPSHSTSSSCPRYSECCSTLCAMWIEWTVGLRGECLGLFDRVGQEECAVKARSSNTPSGFARSRGVNDCGVSAGEEL